MDEIRIDVPALPTDRLFVGIQRNDESGIRKRTWEAVMYGFGIESFITTLINEKLLSINPLRCFDRKAVAALWLLSCVGVANGQTSASSAGIDIDYLTRQGVEERLQSDGVDLLGDQVDPNTGSLVFRHTDVSIPGNSGLEVAIHRSISTSQRYIDGHAFADWELETPIITIIVPQRRSSSGLLDPPEWAGARCTGPPIMAPMIIGDVIAIPNPEGGSSGSYIVNGYEYSNGLWLEIPGRPAQLILNRLDSQWQWPAGTTKVTTDNYAISCIADIGTANGGGEGFIVTSPDGVKYRFDKLIFRRARHIDVADTFLDRSHAIMLATEVTDVSGNKVTYDYNAAGQLQSISANDGRHISIVYANGLISQIKAHPGTADERVWTYTYVSGPSIATRLTAMTLPDNRRWSFNLTQMFVRADPDYNCTKVDHTVSVTHPNGVTGQFTLSEIRHLKGDMNGKIPKTGGCLAPPQEIPYFDAMSLTRKTLSGPGYPTATWIYSYSGYSGGTVPSTKWSKVIDPLGRETVYTYHRGGTLEGLLQKVETFPTAASSVPSETIQHSYLLESAVGTTYLANVNQHKLTQPRRETTTVITRGADTFTTVRVYNTTQSSTLYSHGFPTRVTTSSNASTRTRIVDTVYAHNRAKWVLGLPDTITRNGKLFYDINYDSLGRLKDYSAFGTQMQSVVYHTVEPMKGAIRWVDDALGRRTQFGDYFRGRPRLVTLPDLTTYSRTVDSNGWVTSETDVDGVTLGYDYNDVGWLTLIDRPPAWADTVVTYTGLGGAFQRIATRGTERTTTSYDSMTRPTLVKREAVSGGGTTTYSSTEYNALGMATFHSFPSTSSSPTAGIERTYDPLLRPLTVRENVWPMATTSYAYLAGNMTRVTDPSGAVTTTTVRAYGTPGNGEVIRIEQPLDVTTDLTYDDFGNVLTVRQHGTQNGYTVDQTHHYFYDSRLRLCRHSVPAAGDTLYAYDAANQLIQVARGQGPGTSCTTPPVSAAVVRTYDNMGRVDFVSYPDSAPDIDYAYWPDGLVKTVARGISTWTYDWNELDLLTQERLVVDGRVYQTTYTHNANGAISTQTTPGGRTVHYNPNGFGQPTGATIGGISHVSGMTYHPDGSLEHLVYANGHVLDRTLNERLLVESFQVRKPGTTAVHFAYAYDANRRITAIDDWAATGATGPFGTGSFVYDALGNIREKTLGNQQVETQYNGRNQLASVRLTDNGVAGAWQTYAYADGRGNVTHNGRLGFTYDRAEQPVTMTGQASGTFVYDGNLKRVKQTVNGRTVYSVYGLGGRLLYREREDATGNETTDYIAAGGIPVGRWVNGVPQYVHHDHLGSPVAATDSDGTVLWREEYLPFGAKRQNPPGNADDVGYTGHVQDAATGLTYMQARYYDPVIGRFLSPDPVGFLIARPEMFNRYAYVGNDPINGIDPTGMCEESADGGQCMLTASEVASSITKVDEARLSEKVSTAIEVFDSLPSNAAVTGDTIKEGLAEAGLELDGATGEIVGNIESISKSGDNVEISSSKESTVDIGDGRSVTIGESVSFTVGSDGANPSLSKIQGIKADVGGLVKVVNINKVQAVDGGVDVTGSKFLFSDTVHIPLKDE